MNFLKKTKRIRKKIHIFGLKVFTFLNFMSLIFWISCIDAIISWQPYVIMIFNFAWLYLMAYANGLIYDTRYYYERELKERSYTYYDEM